MRLKAFHAAGVHSLRDLLFISPVRYMDQRNVTAVNKAEDGQKCVLRVKRIGEPMSSYHGHLHRVSCRFADESGEITACWFNQSWMLKQCEGMSEAVLYGTVKCFGRTKQLLNGVVVRQPEIVPVYRPMEGIPQKVHRTLVQQLLPLADTLCEEILPRFLLEKYQLPLCADAIRSLHRPMEMTEVAKAQERFSFEQMLLYQISVQDAKNQRRAAPALNSIDEDAFWSRMPFAPTKAQARSLHEIALDLQKPFAMARMIQGDVGSGKTAVAMGAMLFCLCCGYQAVLMAPTEILAGQHYRELSVFFEKLGFTCGFLSGGLTASERKKAYAKCKSGEWQAVIGTHALISDGVSYRNLALCVTDEQHRFGVNQREALIQKGTHGEQLYPHLLVMSATPIPRSMALILYGDLDLSVIDELPPGRKPVGTHFVPKEKRQDMYAFIRKELQQGHQAYFVCPLVESDDNSDCLKSVKTYADQLQKQIFPEFSVGLLYGSQSTAEKADTLQRFAAGELTVLVATTVIEVGVNVPNASVMVIEDANRFGLAQLHQLRGRVGRGTAQSWCFLLGESNNRLKTLCRTNDGFEVAKDDLEQRGPGELLGVRQSGADIWMNPQNGNSKFLYEAVQTAKDLRENAEYRTEWERLRAIASERIGNTEQRISIS